MTIEDKMNSLSDRKRLLLSEYSLTDDPTHQNKIELKLAKLDDELELLVFKYLKVIKNGDKEYDVT